jgi:hypothetical protein
MTEQNLETIAERLTAKTGVKFSVAQEADKQIIKSDSAPNTMKLTGELQQAGFNAMFRVGDTGKGEGMERLKLEIHVMPNADNKHFPRSTDLETAMKNLEQGKTQPLKDEAKAPQAATQQSFVRG